MATEVHDRPDRDRLAGRDDSDQAGSPGRILLLALLPVVLLIGLLVVISRSSLTDAIRGDAPPVEELTFQRVVLGPTGFSLTVLNDGPDPVTIAQVQVDEAYWAFEQQPEGELHHLQRAHLQIPYPWVEGEAHEIRLVTATGLTFDHEVAVAVATPEPSARFFGIFALIGLYVGVMPVAFGLLWYPVIRRLGRAGLDVVMALTIGLLVFLLIDTAREGLEAAGLVASTYQGTALFAGAALMSYLAIESLGIWMKKRRAGADSALVAAALIALGIGLHNFAEGLAIGAAFALGEAALGTLLIVGFTLHNTTEGLAIVAPLAESRTGVAKLALLGLIAGAPTIAGAWIGGFVYSPVWAVVFLAVGAGAIAQVVVLILRGLAGPRPIAAFLGRGRVMAGLLAGFGLMYGTGLLIG